MSGWPRPRKRLLLAAMLVPWALLLAATALVGTLIASPDFPAALVSVLMACVLGAIVIALVTAATCVADAVVDRRVTSDAARAAWAVALLLAPTAAGPAYWWLHVRPAPGEPHGLQALAPPAAWSRRARAAAGAGAAAAPVFTFGWLAWIAYLFFRADADAAVALPVSLAMGVLLLVTCAVTTVFCLDAVRVGGTHAVLWTTLLVVVLPVAAPLYWLLYVRPTARPGGGP